MGIEARIVATDRFLDDTAEQQSDPSQADAVRSELETHREAVTGYREQIHQLERLIEIGPHSGGRGRLPLPAR